MATQGERRALLFLAAVALLGAGTRACRARRVSVDTGAVDRQIALVDGSAGRQVAAASPRSHAARPPRDPVDMDAANAADIETLPGIGPALARRIVADREANGPFGCLAALDRVKGVGPALLTRIDSLATFSAMGGPPCAIGHFPPDAFGGTFSE